jgi:signal transduction histidine kinase
MALYQRAAAKWSGRGRLHAAEPAVRDWLLALASAGLSLASLAGKVSQLPVTDDEIVPFTEADGLGFALVLSGTIPLAWRRRAPLPLLAVTTISAFLVESLGYPPPPLPFAVLVALFTVAHVSSYRVAAAATAAVAASVAAAAMGASGTFTDDKFLAYLLSIGATGVAGYGLQLSRDRAAQAEQLADLLRKAEVAQTRLAVERERERIVRELHDLVSNSVCVIIAQAGSARRRFAAEPEPVREALASVETTGRQALAELRQLLRVLSTEDPAAQPMPQRGLGDLPSLLSQLERAGLPVTLTVRGEARSLPAHVELAAYRIVQEALTNSLKHAGPAHAEVQLGYSGETLELRVSDDGWGSVGEVVAGRGMAGMRERTSLLGGRLTIGPGEVRGFRLTATLPAEEGRLWAPAS